MTLNYRSIMPHQSLINIDDRLMTVASSNQLRNVQIWLCGAVSGMLTYNASGDMFETRWRQYITIT